MYRNRRGKFPVFQHFAQIIFCFFVYSDITLKAEKISQSDSLYIFREFYIFKIAYQMGLDIILILLVLRKKLDLLQGLI